MVRDAMGLWTLYTLVVIRSNVRKYLGELGAEQGQKTRYFEHLPS